MFSDTAADLIVSLFSPEGFSSLINILIVGIIVIYGIFSILVVRQVNLLNSSFKTDAAWFFTILSFVHLFLAGALVVISILTI